MKQSASNKLCLATWAGGTPRDRIGAGRDHYDPSFVRGIDSFNLSFRAWDSVRGDWAHYGGLGDVARSIALRVFIQRDSFTVQLVLAEIYILELQEAIKAVDFMKKAQAKVDRAETRYGPLARVEHTIRRYLDAMNVDSALLTDSSVLGKATTEISVDDAFKNAVMPLINFTRDRLQKEAA